MINKLRMMLFVLIVFLLTLSGIAYADGNSTVQPGVSQAGAINDTLKALTDKELLSFFQEASYVSQFIYVVLVVLVVIILFNLILFIYLITSNNKASKRFIDMQQSNTKDFSKAVENSAKIHADAIRESSSMHRDSLNKNSETISEVSKSLNLLSQSMLDSNITLKSQYSLIEKLMDQVLKDMSNEHTKLDNAICELRNDSTENFAWCKSKVTHSG